MNEENEAEGGFQPRSVTEIADIIQRGSAGRVWIHVRDGDAACTRGCMGRMDYDGPCESGCCDSGYSNLTMPSPQPTDCPRHDPQPADAEGWAALAVSRGEEAGWALAWINAGYNRPDMLPWIKPGNAAIAAL